MDPILQISYDVTLIKDFLKNQIKDNLQVTTLLIDDESPKNMRLVDIENFLNYVTNNKIHSKVFFKQIYLDALEILMLHENVKKLPKKMLEKEFWYYDCLKGGVGEPTPSSDFYRLKNYNKLNINSNFTETHHHLTSYFVTDYCGFCEYNGNTVEQLDTSKNPVFRSHCKCKKEFIENLEFSYFNTYELIASIENLIYWLKITYPKFKTLEHQSHKNQRLNNFNFETEKVSSKTKNMPWFKVGLHFAKGDFDDYIKQGLSVPEMAKALGNKKYEKNILASINDYDSKDNFNKNIFSKRHNKAQIIYNYCIDNRIKVSDYFIQRADIQ